MLFFSPREDRHSAAAELLLLALPGPGEGPPGRGAELSLRRGGGAASRAVLESRLK